MSFCCLSFRCTTGPPLLSREAFRSNATKAMYSLEEHKDWSLRVKHEFVNTYKWVIWEYQQSEHEVVCILLMWKHACVLPQLALWWGGLYLNGTWLRWLASSRRWRSTWWPPPGMRQPTTRSTPRWRRPTSSASPPWVTSDKATAWRR